MRTLILTLLILLLSVGGSVLVVKLLAVVQPPVEQPAAEQPSATPPAATPPAAEPPDACGPEFQALFDTAVVATTGSGERDAVIVTDPLCWHCRLGHKLLAEYPELYRTVKLSFFPRRSSIGSDMAAWILEDNAGSDRLPELIDFRGRTRTSRWPRPTTCPRRA